MNKKTIISASNKIALELKILAKEKENVRNKLVVTAKQLAKTAKEKESVRKKLAVTAGELKLKATQLAKLAKEKESIRSRLEVTAKKLASTATEKESVRKNLAVIAKEKEGVRNKLVVTAKKLAVIVKEKESIRLKLAVTAKEKERVRLKLVVTAQKLSESRKTLENKVLERTKDLGQAKAKDEAILTSIGDGLVTTDIEGRIALVNKAFEKMLGWKEAEVRGKLLSEIAQMIDENGKNIPDSERPINIILKNRIKATTTTTTTSYYKRRDGNSFPIVTTTSPILLKNEFVGVVVVFRDITEERNIDKAKTEFVSLVSHQLRTPLTTISWCVEMLLKGDIGKILPDQEKYLEKIYQGNQRMIRLVNTILNVSRIELGTLENEPIPTNIAVLAQNVIDEQKPEMEGKKLLFTDKFSKNIPTFLIDPILLRMVFQNLLSNAVEYTPEGGKIELAVSFDDKKTLLIKISDTGYGIPKNQQEKIFTKLFRADNVREKDTDGTGLGLYIVKSIVENFGGKIWFESPVSGGEASENPGTVFYVTLPLNL